TSFAEARLIQGIPAASTGGRAWTLWSGRAAGRRKGRAAVVDGEGHLIACDRLAVPRGRRITVMARQLKAGPAEPLACGRLGEDATVGQPRVEAHDTADRRPPGHATIHMRRGGVFPDSHGCRTAQQR